MAYTDAGELAIRDEEDVEKNNQKKREGQKQ